MPLHLERPDVHLRRYQELNRLESPSTRRVAVIGGGLSGLATAVHLHLADPALDLTLFESGRRLGGVIHTETVDDLIVDHGADMFATKPPAALQLLQKLGVEDRLMLPKVEGRGARIVDRGRLVDLPDGFVLMRATKIAPMLTTPLLSLPGKLRWMVERWIGRTTPTQDDDLSVADFVRRRLGDEVLQRIVGPLVAGIYTADIEKLSMRATMGPIWNMEQTHGSLARATAARRRSGEDTVERGSSGARYEQFRAFKGGMADLIACLADALPAGTVRTESPVDQITADDTKWNVSVAGAVESFDHVVIATPPSAAAKLLSGIADTASEQLGKVETASTAIVVLGVRRQDIRQDINTFGFVVPPRENRRILAGSFASNKFAGRAPDDQVLIRVFMGGALQAHLLEHTDEQLTQIAREELAELIGLQGEPTLVRVVRWNHAMPQYHVGHRTRVDRIEADIDRVANLSLINNALHGVGIAPVVQAAQKLAAKIVGATPPAE